MINNYNHKLTHTIDNDATIACDKLRSPGKDINSACRAFWRAVIMQTVSDAVNNPYSERTELKIAKNNAIKWFADNSPDFQVICSLAGYNSADIRRKALRLIKDRYIKHIALENEGETV